MCVGAGTSMGVTQAAGAISSAAGSIFSAQSQRLGLNLDAYFADLNADGELDNARRALAAGEAAEQRQRLETAQIKSSQRAAMGANGVDLSTGSALDRQVGTDLMGEIDANTIRANAALEAAGYRTRASNYRSQATMSRAGAKSISPLLSGLTSLVGSASSVASDWYSLKKVGAFAKGPNPVGSGVRRGVAATKYRYGL